MISRAAAEALRLKNCLAEGFGMACKDERRTRNAGKLTITEPDTIIKND
jgi:hypothetical protein